MEYNEFCEEMDKIETARKITEDNFSRQKKKLIIEYATRNNEVEVGDIISDSHEQYILVDKIIVRDKSYFSDEPHCEYQGELLTKKLKIRKNPDRRAIPQPNFKKIIRKHNESS